MNRAALPITRAQVLEASLGLRLLIPRLSWGAPLVALVICGIGSVLARNADDALVFALGWVMPLTGYAGFQAALDGGRLDARVRVISRHGVDGKRLWLGAALVLVVWLALTSAMLAALAVIMTHGSFRDVILSAWIGAWGGASYAAWLCFASDWGTPRQARLAFLIADWGFGSSSDFLALPWPRAHIQTLLGGQSPDDMGASGLFEVSSRYGTLGFALLIASGAIALLVGFRRAPR